MKASTGGKALNLCDRSNVLLYWCAQYHTSANPSALSQAVNKVHSKIKMLDDGGGVLDFDDVDRRNVQPRMDALMRIVSDLRLHTLYLDTGTLITLLNYKRLDELFRIAGRNGLLRLHLKGAPNVSKKSFAVSKFVRVLRQVICSLGQHCNSLRFLEWHVCMHMEYCVHVKKATENERRELIMTSVSALRSFGGRFDVDVTSIVKTITDWPKERKREFTAKAREELLEQEMDDFEEQVENGMNMYADDQFGSITMQESLFGRAYGDED